MKQNPDFLQWVCEGYVHARRLIVVKFFSNQTARVIMICAEIQALADIVSKEALTEEEDLCVFEKLTNNTIKLEARFCNRDIGYSTLY